MSQSRDAEGRFTIRYKPYAISQLRQPNTAVITQVQLESARLGRDVLDHRITPDQAVLDAGRNVAHAAVFKHDAAAEFAVLNHHLMINAGEGANIAVFDDRALADNRRTSHHAVDDLRPRLHRDSRIDHRMF